ncbi:hypothetical protein HMPREF9498_00608 [Enterococcus faecalis TX4248]|uniref:Uncharacterized protein n=1 Tax=Enterococcus faecalis TX4248 TaxID=749495 RepID=A0A125W957_ENTFL|nr:hypothetical protein HMPREF9498_00608 [Enterococcus faecalis TX4248]
MRTRGKTTRNKTIHVRRFRRCLLERISKYARRPTTLRRLGFLLKWVIERKQ